MRADGKYGNAGIKDPRGRFCGKEAKPRVTVAVKICARCNEMKDASAFCIDKKSPDSLTSWCKPCKADHERQRKRAHALSRLNRPSLERFTREYLLVELERLAEAAREARSLGMWRGRSAIRAYRDLGSVLDEIHLESPEREDAMDRDAAPCSCPSWPCPRHAEEVQTA